jgi:hypothetical protein
MTERRSSAHDDSISFRTRLGDELIGGLGGMSSRKLAESTIVNTTPIFVKFIVASAAKFSHR